LKYPKAKQQKVINELKKWKYKSLFESLQITLERVQSWSENDVIYNLKGGSFWPHGERRTLAAMAELESNLAAKRGYSVSIDRFTTCNADTLIACCDQS
jgi:hypothetical protein